MTTSTRDALVAGLRNHAGANADRTRQAALWLRDQLAWEHRLAELRGRPLSCAEERPPARRGVA